MTEKKINAFIIRNFRDSGTEQVFTGGTVEPISEGRFGNYKAAGLAREATAAEIKASKGETKPEA